MHTIARAPSRLAIRRVRTSSPALQQQRLRSIPRGPPRAKGRGAAVERTSRAALPAMSELARTRLAEERKAWRKVRRWAPRRFAPPPARFACAAVLPDEHCQRALPSSDHPPTQDHPAGFVAKMRSLPDGSTDLFVWDCLVPGPAGGDWAGGAYPLTLHFPSAYPDQPPIARRARAHTAHLSRCLAAAPQRRRPPSAAAQLSAGPADRRSTPLKNQKPSRRAASRRASTTSTSSPTATCASAF